MCIKIKQQQKYKIIRKLQINMVSHQFNNNLQIKCKDYLLPVRILFCWFKYSKLKRKMKNCDKILSMNTGYFEWFIIEWEWKSNWMAIANHVTVLNFVLWIFWYLMATFSREKKRVFYLYFNARQFIYEQQLRKLFTKRMSKRRLIRTANDSIYIKKKDSRWKLKQTRNHHEQNIFCATISCVRWIKMLCDVFISSVLPPICKCVIFWVLNFEISLCIACKCILKLEKKVIYFTFDWMEAVHEPYIGLRKISMRYISNGIFH